LIASLGLPTAKGRLIVNDDLTVPGVEHAWALGDAAAVPDLSQPPTGDGDRPLTAPTAQHAQRQGRAVARNVAASFGVGRARPYRHRDLGLVADLGGVAAVARPFGLPLTGPAAKVVTKGYHLFALPSAANRLRVGADWATNLVSRPIAAQLGLVPPDAAQLGREQAGSPAVG
jgi:NADH dehydrogenase